LDGTDRIPVWLTLVGGSVFTGDIEQTFELHPLSRMIRMRRKVLL